MLPSVMAWALRICVIAWFVAAGTVLVVRHVLMPSVDALREPIAAMLAQQLALPVSIERIEGSWAGWRPRLRIEGLRIADREGREALTLGSIDATVAWSSLLRGEPHFERLDIQAPELVLRRDSTGNIFVAGIALPAGTGEEGSGLDWLLAQRQIVIHGARLTWQDEVRVAPALVLEGVALRLDRRGSKVRFALDARPPPALASALVVRGEVARASRLASLQRLSAAAGRMYVELERADLGGWHPWFDYPLPLAGHGGVRAWADADGEGGLELTADVALDGVHTQLGEALPALDLTRLDGRLSMTRGAKGSRFGARGLALTLADGLTVSPTDFELRLAQGGEGEPAGGAMSANRLDFAALAVLASYLPFDAGVRTRLARFAPSGKVEDLRLAWRGDPGAPTHWALAARLEGVGLLAREGWPGVGGLSGRIDGDADGGRFQLTGSGMHIDLPTVFDPGRLDFDRLRAEGGWQRRNDRMEVALDSAEFDNADVAGTASGRYWPAADGPGEIDLQARLSRADSTAVWRYLPRLVNAHTREWVQQGIRAAGVPEARLRLQGKLQDFPFRDGAGQFLVTVRVADGVLDYAPGWPGIEGIQGEVRFEGPGMRISAERGRILGVDLVGVVADVPELDARPSEIMTITGRALGPTAEFLRFVAASPVSRRIGGFTDGIRAEGSGELELKLVMPLRSTIDTAVEGVFRFAGNRIELLDGLPALERAGGVVRFTGDTLAIPEASAQFLGQKATVSAKTGADGVVRFEAVGRADAAAVRARYPQPLLDGVSGTAAWRAAIRVGKGSTRVEVDSDLLGFASSLPAPLNKSAGEVWPSRFVFEHASGRAIDTLGLTLGAVLRAQLMHAPGAGELRGGIAIGRATGDAPPASESGLRVAAVLDRLDVDAWRRVLEAGEDVAEADGSGSGAEAGADPAASTGGAALAVAGLRDLALAADEVRAFGHTLKAVDLRAEADAGGWKARLESDIADGAFDWRNAGDGALRARFRHLRVGQEDPQGGKEGESAERGGDAAEQAEPVDEAPPRRLPALDVVAEEFELRGLALGRLEVFARNRGGLWQLERFNLANDDGRLAGSGQWQAAGRQRTRLDFSLETPDFGRLSSRLGYPDVVRGGQASLTGQLGWQGAPTRIDYPSLNGSLKLETGSGQFNKLEPGVGRLLGILSLQALPRRITLDFRDVFSEGFAFDRISGSIDVAAGVLRTEDLEIRGPSARVKMTGSADVVAETQDLRVLVQPTLSESIAIGAAAGLLNPAVGVITYLAQKVLSDPIEKIFAFEYVVTGAWSDPQVAKRGQEPEPQ
ncbi:YhdP family protein [Thauera sp.]|uniref:YhdP family protein n=1 Tax=Thauera sp. TaxID=1905334 RepID=UPI002A36FA27|nr:YhdP family protein [Thauera sp.]MDX9884358.1 YhdP family protein [Thauera sp.]